MFWVNISMYTLISPLTYRRPQRGLCCFSSCCRLSHGCQQLLLRNKYTYSLKDTQICILSLPGSASSASQMEGFSLSSFIFFISSTYTNLLNLLNEEIGCFNWSLMCLVFWHCLPNKPQKNVILNKIFMLFTWLMCIWLISGQCESLYCVSLSPSPCLCLSPSSHTHSAAEK